jgi:hypothetical protein
MRGTDTNPDFFFDAAGRTRIRPVHAFAAGSPSSTANRARPSRPPSQMALLPTSDR